jgi:outer membrane biosynthesis protein TonB
MPTHRAHRIDRVASWIVGLALLAGCSSSPGLARGPAPSPAECRAREAERLAESGFRPGADLDSLREAQLDSGAVRFRERRRPDPDKSKRLDRAPRLLNTEFIQRWMSTDYPPMLLREGVGGSTLLLFFARPDSTPAMIRVVRSSGVSDLDLASVNVMQHARFAPGIYHGCPVWAMIIMPVNWEPPPRPRN